MSDILYNGTQYPDKSYGYFGSTVCPDAPHPSLGTTQQLDVLWGSRLCEMVGRAKGLAGVGTVETTGVWGVYEGTCQIMFPPNFFSDIPIININMYKRANVWGILETQYDNSERDLWIPCQTNNEHGDRRAVFSNLIIRDVTVNGFKVCYSHYDVSPTTSEPNPGNRPFSWTAIGI